MKYYYINNNGFMKYGIKSEFDEEKINNIKDGIIIVKVEGKEEFSKKNNTFSLDNTKYHVIKIEKSIFEKEKLEFNFEELINYLKNEELPLYFLNMPKKVVSMIIYGIKKELFHF